MVSVILLAASVFSLACFAQGCVFPYDAIGTQCLYVDPLEEGAWYDMRLYCTKLNGHLAKIPDASQHQAIVSYIREEGLDHASYWTGANDDDYEGQWKWSDGTDVPLSSTFWRYDCDADRSRRPKVDPDRNCAVLDMEANFYFADVDCTGAEAGKFCPICEMV
ncbi:C-type lectin domain family 17, member A-like isoform X2 [Macrobrachium rosenbergii]|uniref:C-type lectin domain family 17, member A-like isoform X2 n=1 Tax=Macrobrachium rosenbergii TaxID=79674 RepID=UPI0034D633FA